MSKQRKKKNRFQGHLKQYECYECGHKAVMWGSQLSFDDCGYSYDGNGYVDFYKCSFCGAEYECKVQMDQKEEER